MPSLRLPALDALGGAETERFPQYDYLVVERILGTADLEPLREAFPRRFAGRFDIDTGRRMPVLAAA